jgi:hypothetical protein
MHPPAELPAPTPWQLAVLTTPSARRLARSRTPAHSSDIPPTPNAPSHTTHTAPKAWSPARQLAMHPNAKATPRAGPRDASAPRAGVPAVLATNQAEPTQRPRPSQKPLPRQPDYEGQETEHATAEPNAPSPEAHTACTIPALTAEQVEEGAVEAAEGRTRANSKAESAHLNIRMPAPKSRRSEGHEESEHDARMGSTPY